MSTYTIHDSGYKKLFSNKVIFRQLIESFVYEDWVKEIDFEQSETLDKSFVSDHYKESESDLIYKVTFKGREAYLVILLEFQSSVERFMALRVLNYITNFYMDYVESTEKVRMLPPVFPIVLYNSEYTIHIDGSIQRKNPGLLLLLYDFRVIMNSPSGALYV